MFDIGFSELLLVALVAMLVVGPKRLPETLRVVGLWVGRTRRKAGEVRRSLEQELGVDEVREQLLLERAQAARARAVAASPESVSWKSLMPATERPEGLQADVPAPAAEVRNVDA
ncbi:Sec-independent protein translocase protein TatB [Pseudomonas aeruginosa]